MSLRRRTVGENNPFIMFVASGLPARLNEDQDLLRAFNFLVYRLNFIY